MEYYYTPIDDIKINESRLFIRKDEFRHLIKVLKKKINDKIVITDGNRNVYDCYIKSIFEDKIECGILNSRYNINEPKIKITLALSLLKNLDRFEFAIEKAVELGVSEIYPVITEYTINKKGLSDTKIKRLNSISLSAMKQSQRCYLPIVHNSVNFSELMSLSKNYESKILMYEFADSNSKIENRNLKNNCLLLIGPEGGFSKLEVETLTNQNWSVYSLGERKLRAETAAIISVFNILNKIN
jgi:16S rRNA (uracil1498-N3)-methyltransferase